MAAKTTGPDTSGEWSDPLASSLRGRLAEAIQGCRTLCMPLLDRHVASAPRDDEDGQVLSRGMKVSINAGRYDKVVSRTEKFGVWSPSQTVGNGCGDGWREPSQTVTLGSKSARLMDLQRDALLAAEVDERHLFEDRASGSRGDRAGLAKALTFIRAGDCLVVWKLDRLGRSLPHLLTTVTDLKARGIAFRSLTDRSACRPGLLQQTVAVAEVAAQ